VGDFMKRLYGLRVDETETIARCWLCWNGHGDIRDWPWFPSCARTAPAHHCTGRRTQDV